MWEFVRVKARNLDAVGEYLKKGYEPFAVSIDPYGSETIWLKREADEVPSKPDKPDKKASRRAAAKTKE